MSRALMQPSLAIKGPNGLTAGQIAYLDWHSWCLRAQEIVADGFDPTPEVAKQLRRQCTERDERDRGESCRTGHY